MLWLKLNWVSIGDSSCGLDSLIPVPFHLPPKSSKYLHIFAYELSISDFWLKTANTAPIPAHSPLLESLLDASQWMEILVAEFLDNLAELLEALVLAARITPVVLGLLLTLLLWRSDALRELHHGT